MKMRWLLVIAGATACASTDAILGEVDGSAVVPDAVADGGSDAEPADLDAAPCADDCEHFPATCTDDAFCPNGPFEPNTPGGSLDPRAQINIIRGRSATDVWAAGALGALAHFDGTSWTRSDLGAGDSLRALWLRDSSEVAVAELWRIFARGVEVDAGVPPSTDGWTLAPPLVAPPEFLEYQSLYVVSAWTPPGSSSLWLAMRAAQRGKSSGLWRVRANGSSELELRVGVPPAVCRSLPCSQMTSIHGVSANVLWATGQEGVGIRVTDAESDSPNVDVFYTDTFNALNGVWAISDSEAWAVGARGTIRHYTGDPLRWDVVPGVPTTSDLNAVWASSPSDIWVVGDAGVVLHYDGKVWSRVKVAGLGPRRPNLTTVWGAAAGKVWIGGQGAILSLGGKP